MDGPKRSKKNNTLERECGNEARDRLWIWSWRLIDEKHESWEIGGAVAEDAISAARNRNLQAQNPRKGESFELCSYFLREELQEQSEETFHKAYPVHFVKKFDCGGGEEEFWARAALARGGRWGGEPSWLGELAGGSVLGPLDPWADRSATTTIDRQIILHSTCGLNSSQEAKCVKFYGLPIHNSMNHRILHSSRVGLLTDKTHSLKNFLIYTIRIREFT